MAHGFNRWAWSQATFAVAGQAWTADIDALAVRRGAGKFVRIHRSNVKFPSTDFNRSGPTYTTLCGTVVRIEIDRVTGVLRIAKAFSVLECGQAVVPEVVLGQAQGGFAMGVGYALLETLPLYEDGPGNGKWNLGQYPSHGDRTCRSTGSRLRCCHPSMLTLSARRGHRGSRDDPDSPCASQRHL
jgi:CO/xanthine dehydrogenase Mo-binding subunit